VGTITQAAGKQGVQLERVQPKKRQRIPQAVEIGHIVADLLNEMYPDADWIHQTRDGVIDYLEKCIERFTSTPKPVNAPPITSGYDYRQRARTAEEIKAEMAAEEGSVSRAPSRLARYRERPEEVEIPEAEVAHPMEQPTQPVKPPKKTGWVV
jgi:hypothetical protein